MGVPKVSVIMPVYNDAEYLEQSLGSALGQTLADLELICVDDGSTDGSREMIEYLASEDPRLKPLFHSTNMSSSQARKDGVAASTGEYVMFLDGDDELVPEACETAYAAIEESRTDLVEFGTEVVNCGGMPQSRIDANQRRLEPHLGRIEAENLIGPCFVDKKLSFTLWNKIYRGDLCREAFSDIEDGSFPKAQDLYAFFAIAYRARSYQGIEERLYRYCFGRGVTGGNVMSLKKFDVLLQEERVSEALERLARSKDATEQLAPAIDEVRSGFIGECVDRWLRNLSDEWAAEGFDRLVDTWGMEDVVCALAERHWYDVAVPKKALQTDRFRCEAREPGKRLHVAYHYRCIQDGGAQRVAAELCSLWAGMEGDDGEPLYDVTLVTDGGPLEDEYPLDPRVRREYLPDRLESSGGAYRERYRAWQRIIDEDGLDIVVSGMWVDAVTLWDLLSVKGAPSRPAFMVHCHNFTMVPNLWEGSAFQRLMYLYRLCDGAAVLSGCDLSYVGLFCANARYIPNPVSYVAGNAPAEPEGPSIVWTGRIAGEKRPVDLIYMMERVVQRVPDARLYLVGDGDEELAGRMRDEASRMGLERSIAFTGFTTDVDPWYGRAAVFVNTSSYEGFPLTVAEALSHSLPVAMYDLPWLEFVRDGRGIRTVEQGRYDLLAREVVQLLEDPEGARRLGREGRGQIDDLLQVDIAGEWQALFRGIDPDARPAGWDSDERVLFQYATEWQEKTRNSLQRSRDAEKKRSRALFDRFTARVDIKVEGDSSNDVEVLEVSDPDARMDAPDWFCDEQGTGHVLESTAGSLDAKLRCIGAGELSIVLRGQCVRDAEGNFVPAWIDYTSFSVDGRELLGGTRAVWHNKPFKYRMPVTDGQVVDVSLTWHSHDEAGLEAEQERVDALNSQIRALKGENASLQKAEKKQEKELATAAKELATAEDEVLALRSSNSWKIGRFITWLPRKIKALFRRLRGR